MSYFLSKLESHIYSLEIFAHLIFPGKSIGLVSFNSFVSHVFALQNALFQLNLVISEVTLRVEDNFLNDDEYHQWLSISQRQF